MSDNGHQFASSEFARFAETWEFEHVTSSPHHSQSNGKVGSAVNIFITYKTDLILAILERRNMPTVGMSASPVQQLMSRHARTLTYTRTLALMYI